MSEVSEQKRYKHVRVDKYTVVPVELAKGEVDDTAPEVKAPPVPDGHVRADSFTIVPLPVVKVEAEPEPKRGRKKADEPEEL